MANKPHNESALAIGGILAGWEIDPNWVPQAGDKVVISFIPVSSTQYPGEAAVTLTAFHILAAVGMRAGGRGLSQTMQAAVGKAAETWGKGGGPGGVQGGPG